jgi:hypothetical protein
MTCPHLDYRADDEDHDFDHERPYCTVTGEFVSPMKADVCNDRHDFEHTADCEIVRAAADEQTPSEEQPTPEPTD